ncbi:UDP-N-acetylmuramoyl-tripeptide--D-alanyl-D-alanine ligase [Bacillus tuaregi]|uniref:UDP-N-acetylmuramoyl-tripeptide--D-alanyl-D- alanine ligase n=1 Tax=Bacillus tuaregi TaxID=1816695 RepID=UPI0008F8342F|nr:UDP-N-acetylmuramoyl-tripeptide--D-alanyl-D-alanine ligase [Bacillus tuaregi]
MDLLKTTESPIIIAVTGSAGKTTTKEMISAIVKQRGSIFKTMYNLNLPHHTAKYAGQINSTHYAAVLEYALSKPGHINMHCELLKPHIGVITNIGSAHIGRFDGDMTKLVEGKGELIEGLHQQGMVVINQDDPYSQLLNTESFTGKIVKVGMVHSADYQAEKVNYSDKGMTFEVRIDGFLHRFEIPLFGTHNVYNALCAIAVGHHLGFSIEELAKGLRNFSRPARRIQVRKLADEMLLIDDSFSSNPHAAKAALDVLSHLGTGLKVALLGSMLELGNYSVQGHQEIGRYVKEKDIDWLYLYGKAALEIGKAAAEAGFPTSKIKHFKTKNELHQQLEQISQPGMTLLIKGSHALKLYETANFMKVKFRI